jgi:dolichyl-phosphate-mannose--protein O-mannosyl transferase
MAVVSTATDQPTHRAETTHGSMVTLGRTVDGEPLPRLRRRLTPLHYRSDAMWGWLAPVVITVLSGVLNFWSITTPHDLTFDETYYAKDAYSLLVKGYASNFVNDGDDDNGNEADELINAGTTDGIFADGVSKVVHPEAGKWMIAGGEWLFGMTPLGWRFSAALVGTLMVLVTCRLVRRLTGSTWLGCLAGALLALDGLHFTMSRIALLDVFLAFWLLCGVHCLVADRDWARARLARRYEVTPADPVGTFGPVRGFLLRPWRILAGVCFGLACGTKWSGVFVVGAFGLLVWAWDSGMRRSIGVRWAPLKSFVVDAVPAFFSIIVVGLVVYTATWAGFLTHAEQFEEAFAEPTSEGESLWTSVDDDPDGPVEGFVHDLNILWNYHKEVYAFHTGDYIRDAEHPFESHPGGWLVLNRPLGISALSGDDTVLANCPPGESCVRQVLAIGTPVLWWGGVLALVVSAGFWLTRRDWRFGVPVVGVLSTWLPWFRYDDRQIFFYYAISIVPFTVIAIALVAGKVVGRPGLTTRRSVALALTGAFVIAVAVNFVYFYPILTDRLLTNESWHDRMWLESWI